MVPLVLSDVNIDKAGVVLLLRFFVLALPEQRVGSLPRTNAAKGGLGLGLGLGLRERERERRGVRSGERERESVECRVR